jgi:hypothetical protein
MPCTRSLLQTIECFDKTTKMMWVSRINETWWLTHIYLLLQNTMKESILNI